MEWIIHFNELVEYIHSTKVCMQILHGRKFWQNHLFASCIIIKALQSNEMCIKTNIPFTLDANARAKPQWFPMEVIVKCFLVI